MKINRSMSFFVATGVLALAALGVAGTAQAQDVYWSVGLSSPGVHVGVASAPPVVVRPAYQPVYVQQSPVYAVPPAVGALRPVPVYGVPQPSVQAGWQPPGRAWGWHHRHGHHAQERFEHGRFNGERSGRGQQDYRRD